MPRINLYAQNRHTLVIDGVPISGFAEGDWLSWKQDGNAAARSHGGDGPSMNLSTDQGGKFTLDLMPTSPALGTLYAMRKAQKNNPRMFTLALMTGVEEVVTGSGCAFGELPEAKTGGPTQQPRQFVVEALKIEEDTSAVESILGGFVGGLL